jgi:hypothetical protein
MNSLKVYFYQFYETIAESGLKYALSQMFYIRKKAAVLLERNLEDFNPVSAKQNQQDVRLVSLGNNNFRSLGLSYPLKNRYYKAISNLKEGYQGYCLVRGDEVIGDLWCSFATPGAAVHPDIKLLGISLGEKEVYGYDMYIPMKERGNASIASLLLGGALNDLKSKGYKNLKCYVMADRLPALWLHRVLGFKEFGRVETQRVLSYRQFKPVNN